MNSQNETFISHLTELRYRLMISLSALLIGFFIGPIQAASRSVIVKKVRSSDQLSAFCCFAMFGNICAIFGTGIQASSHLTAMKKVRKIQKFLIFSRSDLSAKQFCSAHSKKNKCE